MTKYYGKVRVYSERIEVVEVEVDNTKKSFAVDLDKAFKGAVKPLLKEGEVYDIEEVEEEEN